MLMMMLLQPSTPSLRGSTVETSAQQALSPSSSDVLVPASEDPSSSDLLPVAAKDQLHELFRHEVEADKGYGGGVLRLESSSLGLLYEDAYGEVSNTQLQIS